MSENNSSEIGINNLRDLGGKKTSEDKTLKKGLFFRSAAPTEWNDNVKNYRETAMDRVKIHTPSSSQVILPLYKSSIGKWKNYARYFDDCNQYLEKWVSYFDYYDIKKY